MAVVIGGALVAAAAGITEAMINNNKTVDTSNVTSGVTNQTTGTSVTGTQSNITDSSATQTVTNSADPDVIASMKALAQEAIGNSQDPTKTQGLITGIIQQAGDAMTAVFGQQGQSGLYNSAATATQNDDIVSRATAEAAQAVLGYQTTEQGIGQNALQSLLAATSTQTTATNSHVDNEQSSTVDTQATQNTTVNQTIKQQQTTSAGMSLVCTWMHTHGYLSKRLYLASTLNFRKLPWYISEGYLVLARQLIKELDRDENSVRSRIIMWVFHHRTKQVCAKLGLRRVEKSFEGWLCSAIIACAIFPTSFYFWLQHIGFFGNLEVTRKLGA